MRPDLDLATVALIISASHVPEGGLLPVPIPIRFRYHAANPHALSIGIGSQKVWTVARDTIRDGLHIATGQGNIGLIPMSDMVQIRLHGPADDGTWAHMAIEIPRDIVQAVVSRCYTIVPAGTEDQHIDWDRELAGLLGGGRRG